MRFRLFVLFLVPGFLGWVLLLCASAWGLGLAGACLRLGAVRYFVSRLFDKFHEVLCACFLTSFVMCRLISTVLSSSCWFELSQFGYV